MATPNCRDTEPILGCYTDSLGVSRTVAVHYAYDSVRKPVAMYVTEAENLTAVDITDGTLQLGACDLGRDIDTCFVGDQYAYQWAWRGTGQLQRYDPLTQAWEYYGLTQDDAGTTIGGYALAFKNDTVDPTLFFQDRFGNLYKASPDDPLGTFSLVGSTGLPAQPCFDFDPSGRLLIGDGRKVWEIDPTTGASNFLGDLIDIRSGANLNASPGDWFFDPSGNWFMMARDNAGATYGECTGTVLWQIDLGTLEATRISPSCSPVSGTGATWLAAGRYLLSTGAGQVYEYNSYTDEWSVLTTAPQGINDLAAQWVIPDPIPVVGRVKISPDGSTCETILYTFEINSETLELECQPFEPTISGKFDHSCSTEPNPFVSDPFSPSSGGDSGCDRCPDEVWQTGCSDAGSTLWRTSYDAAGNASTEYLYGTLASPTTVAPPGYTALPCGVTQAADISIVPFCNDDTNITVYRRDEGGVISWFDASGTITEPPNITPGECPSNDPNVITSDAVICLDGEPSVRRVIEIYVPNDDGLPELDSTQIIYFNESGSVWDSDVDTTPEPDTWFFGDCVQTYEQYERVKLCEEDDRKLLLIDSGGAFSKLSLNTDAIDPLPIPVASAGAGADLENFILYAITGNSLLAVDVNSDTQLYTIPLFSNDGSPTTASAASFYAPTGELWFYDYGPDALFAINVTTGEVTRVAGPYTGVAGSGSSLAINPVDNKVYVTGSNGLVYELDPTGANLAAALVYDSISGANGATFDDSGTLYFGSGAGNDNNFGEVYAVPDFPNGDGYTVLGDWGPGVNSLAFYNVQAQKPSCFFRKFGITEEGDYEYLSDHWVADGTERTIVGAIDCCECSDTCGGSEGGSSGGTTTVEFPDPDPRTASFSSELTTGGGNGTVPANIYSITVFNDSNDTIQVSIGGDVQIIPRRSSHNWFRDFETEQPFTAGAATVTALSGTLNANERVIFNYKEIS